MARSSPIALVLSGGGARGAYEAGVVAGLVEVLGATRFDLMAGTSVGAINASYLASHAHRDDLGIDHLVTLWGGLGLRSHLRLARHPLQQHALLDVRPFEEVVRTGVDWARLAENIDGGTLQGLFVAALQVDSGRTAVFADLAPDARWVPSKDPQRHASCARLTAEHVLASAAIPGVFPPRAVDGRLYYDGGLRFNTPISPVLRAGAERLVVASPLHAAADAEVVPAPTPDPLFLAGKMLHAVLLDPFAYDLQVLDRFNELLAVLDDTLDGAERDRFDARCIELRGTAYRQVEALVFSPSQDLGRLGVDYLRRNRRRLLRQGLGGLLLAMGSRRLAASGTDLVSYLLFDGGYTRQLVALGRHDVWARAAEVRAFFRG